MDVVPSLNAYSLLSDFSAHGDDGALGKLLSVIVGLVHPDSPKRGALRLLLASGLGAKLYSAEFLDGLGPRHLNSRRLVRHTFRVHAGAPHEACRGLVALASAGVLNLYSRSALAALHEGWAAWHVDGRALLVGQLVGEQLETFAQLGEFLRLLLDSPASCLSPAQEAVLLRGVLACEDVRDLAGATKDLKGALPEHAAVIGEALAAEEQASDEDAEGNLAGFVCGDSEVSFDSSEEEEEEEEEEEDKAAGARGKKRGRGGASESAGKLRLRKQARLS
jgi:hypothetical protein